MAYTNNNGQTRIGVRIVPQVNASSLWNSIYSVYNADATGSSSLKTSLVASYNGESNANDSKGTNNGTAMGGLTYTTGKIGNAFQFNGSNSYVSLPDNSWNFTGTLSINIWAYLSSSNTNSVLYSNYYYSAGGRDYGFLLEHQSNGNLRFYMQTSSNSPVILSTSYSGKYNSWKMITITKLQNGSLKMYIDGTSIATNNSTPDIFYNSINYTSIAAARYLGTTYGYLENNGKIDALNIWQKSLTQSEITELYNSGNGAQYIGDNFYKPTTNDALNTNNGTAQGGLTYGVGKVGTAFQFNGSNAYVDYGDNFDLGLYSWTYSFWTIPTSLIGLRTFFSKSVAGPMDGRFYALAYENFFTVGMQVATIGGTPNIIEVRANANVIPTSWTMMTIVFDRSDKIKCYFNGNQIAMTTLTGTNNLLPYSAINYNTSIPFRIGAYTAFDGVTPMLFAQNKMDAFNVWNKVLTQSEITELYNSGNGKQYPN